MKKKILEKTTKVQEFELPVAVIQDDSGFLASCPIWTDCYAQGDTIDEAMNEIISVTASLIEIYKEEGLAIPLKLKKSIKKNFLFRIPVIVPA